MTKARSDFEPDTEMLEEYDFTKGVRGKYYQAYENNNLRTLPGVQFLVDYKGSKTGVLLYLSEHHNLCYEIISQGNYDQEIQYLVNNLGQKIAIKIDFSTHLFIWEKIYDRLIEE
jgi:hypothetical protein